MGLAAGQARLLTITARKSDCEFQSMRLSHQKIALARDLANLSNEYQNSLDQTKLIYDYYGNGDTSNVLTYNTLMTPSVLNDFTPTLVTDSMGRVVLNSKYAAAARQAGIPQEGLGTLPSEATRNNFIQQLAGVGLITDKLAQSIQSLPYSQQAGFGGGATVVSNIEDVSYDDLLNEYFANVSVGDILNDLEGTKYEWDEVNHMSDRSTAHIRSQNDTNDDTFDLTENELGKLTLKDLIDGVDGKHYTIWLDGDDGANNSEAYFRCIGNMAIWDRLFEAMFSVLDNGTSQSELAYNYAVTTFKEEILSYNSDTNRPTTGWLGEHSRRSAKKVRKWVRGQTNKTNGIIVERNKHSKYNTYAGINLTNALKQFLTYYYIMANGFANNKDAYGNDIYKVATGYNSQIVDNKFVDSNAIFQISTDASVSSDDLAQAVFYDTLFNQICANGWVENERIEEPSYLQEMLQSGMMFISKQKDDYFYYQSNYATDNYIKEIADETLIAKAEAKYNTEKARLNAKEETIDLKMKNLDTEISSLTTEYDTVKNALSKNIEKSFKRYSA